MSGDFLNDTRLHSVTTPAGSGTMRDLAMWAKALGLHFSRGNHTGKQWLTPATAPTVLIGADSTDYEFTMPGNQTPNLEIPHLMGPDATAIRVGVLLAVPEGMSASPLRLKCRTQTLLTGVTTATSSAAWGYQHGQAPITAGWHSRRAESYTFWSAGITHTPADLGVSRLQAVSALVRWDVTNDNVLESSGGDPLAMDLTIKMAAMFISSRDQVTLYALGSP